MIRRFFEWAWGQVRWCDGYDDCLGSPTLPLYSEGQKFWYCAECRQLHHDLTRDSK